MVNFVEASLLSTPEDKWSYEQDPDDRRRA